VDSRFRGLATGAYPVPSKRTSVDTGLAAREANSARRQGPGLAVRFKNYAAD
jgi:hypothetical protein